MLCFSLVFVFSFLFFLFIMISKMVYSAGGASVSGSQSGGNGGPVIVELPLDKIRRPLMRTRANDPHKVKELMDSIQEIGLQVPVSILLFSFLYLGFFCILIFFKYWVFLKKKLLHGVFVLCLVCEKMNGNFSRIWSIKSHA